MKCKLITLRFTQLSYQMIFIIVNYILQSYIGTTDDQVGRSFGHVRNQCQ